MTHKTDPTPEELAAAIKQEMIKTAGDAPLPDQLDLDEIEQKITAHLYAFIEAHRQFIKDILEEQDKDKPQRQSAP